MTVETRRRSYSEDDVASALTSLRGNEGRIRSTARDLAIPAMTLSQWASEARRPETAENAPRRHEVSTRQVEETIQTLSEVIPQALARVKEALPSLNGYQAMLTAAIAIDKRQLLSGGATSRTEVLRARYVEPGDLRKLSGAVIDTTVSPRRRGVSERASPSHLPALEKRPSRKRTRKAKVNLPGDETGFPTGE